MPEASSEGAGKVPILEDASHPRFDQESDLLSPAPSPSRDGLGSMAGDPKGSKGKAHSWGREQSRGGQGYQDATFSEPIRRSSRICLQEPAGQKQGLFTRIEPGRMGMATYCMKCVVGSSDSPEVEGQWSEPGAGQPASGDAPHCGCCGSSAGEERAELKPWGIQEQPRARSELHLCTSYGATRSLPRTCQPFGTSGKKKGDSACLGPKDRSWRRWGAPPSGKYRSTVNLVSSNNGSVSSSSSSLDSLESPDFSKGWPESARKQAGTLQREMNALFSEKMEEIRSKSPIFFTDVYQFSMHRSAPSLRSLQTIHEEPLVANENQPSSFRFLLPTRPIRDPKEDSVPRPSQEAVPDGREHLERTSRLEHRTVSEKTLLAPSVLGEEEEMGSTKEGEGRTRAPLQGGLLHPQVQHHLTLDNCGLHPAGDSQKKTADKRREEQSEVGPPNQSERDNSTTPTPLCTTPKGTATVPVPPTVVRRPRDEGYKRCDHGVPLKHPENCSPTPEVYWDATVHDRIWSKLDFSTHRDSMSSSSSMSSNDTVIDLSLPNLARKSLPDLGAPNVVPQRRTARPWSANAASGHEGPTVTKSKSNPNLRLDQPVEDDWCPRPLGFSSVSRRHTWNRLYVDSLKRSCLKPEEQRNPDPNHMKSKSLGDLTSDDIKSTSESKYRSISRSFATRSVRAHDHRRAFKTSGRSPDELTERLKKLTFFQQEDDITSPTCLEPPKAEEEAGKEEEEEEEEEETVLIRRSSSRSQSRVRYIANRARQAQERQKLKNLALSKGSPIEERGIPEGACCFPGGPYTDLASPGLFTSQLKNPTDLNPDAEVVFTFRL
ncbi:hypothetical protein E2320_006203 [Naja naja]|nr:hypothetical protein E2320_006203 [Naja naja]